jgi:DNA polymerase alpha subunit B
VKVDYQLVEQYAMFDSAPHLMFLPSKFRYFVRVVEDCVVINPERLIKGTGAGTFARVEVRAGPVDQKLCDRVSCQIYSV